MHPFRSVVLAGALAAVAASAHAGAGVVQATMTPLSPTVTYAADAARGAPALVTYIGYTLSLANVGGNTVNAVQFTVTISATDKAETVALLDPASLPPSCTPPAPDSSFTCTVGQLKAGESFPPAGAPLVLFYKAPAKVDGNVVGDALGSDVVQAVVHVQYAEGTNGPNSVPQNSIHDWPAGPVTLGTDNPVDVKSAVPAAGSLLFTGTGGVPSTGNRLAELVTVPSRAPGSFGTAAIAIAKVLDTDTADPQCGNLGHFFECPTYKTTVPGDFLASPWLVTVYRIDASNLKLSASKTLGSVLLTYSDGVVTGPVLACVNNAPTGTGVPCVLKAQCYKRSTPGWTPDLDGDCEWTLINTRNGSLKIQ